MHQEWLITATEGSMQSTTAKLTLYKYTTQQQGFPPGKKDVKKSSDWKTKEIKEKTLS